VAPVAGYTLQREVQGTAGAGAEALAPCSVALCCSEMVLEDRPSPVRRFEKQASIRLEHSSERQQLQWGEQEQAPMQPQEVPSWPPPAPGALIVVP